MEKVKNKVFHNIIKALPIFMSYGFLFLINPAFKFHF